MEEWTTLLAVGITWPPPRWIGLSANTASRIFTLVPRTGSSHKGPSLVAHWKPCTMLALQDDSKLLSTSLGRVSSIKRLVPRDGESPKAHTDREERRSQPYWLWKNRPNFRLSQSSLTLPASNRSAIPSSKGSAIQVSLLRLLVVYCCTPTNTKARNKQKSRVSLSTQTHTRTSSSLLL